MLKNELFEYIKNVNYPYWDLYKVDGFKGNRLRSYKLEDIESDAKPEEKLTASLNALEITLSSFPATDKFRIVLKNSETANGSGIYGPVEFTNMNAEMPLAQSQRQAPANFSGFSGLPDFNQLQALGYVPEVVYKAQLDAVRLENQKALQDMEYRIKEENLKREYKKKQEDLRREIEETRRAREEANNGINKIVEVGKRIAPAILGKLFNIPVEELSGPGEGPREVEVKDAKYIEIEKLATELYDSYASLDEIQQLRNHLKQQNYELHKEEEN